MGNGHCVLIQSDTPEDWIFGTANPTWAGHKLAADGDARPPYCTTDVSSDSTDAGAIADAIERALGAYREQSTAPITVEKLLDITSRALSVIELSDDCDEHVDLRAELSHVVTMCQRAIDGEYVRPTSADMPLLFDDSEDATVPEPRVPGDLLAPRDPRTGER